MGTNIYFFPEIKSVLNNPSLFEKYEDFMVRRVLAVDPDTRFVLFDVLV